MARKKINGTTEYIVTAIGYCVGGHVEKAQIQAARAGKLRQDIWNKFGSLGSWGKKADELYKAFQETNPPEMYKLDFKQWQQTFNRVIDDIHACQEAAKTAASRKIYRRFSEPEMKLNKLLKKTKEQVKPDEPNFRKELIESLQTLAWMDYPLLHRWVRSAYHRGHTWVDNQICVGIGNGATVNRRSRNVVSIEFSGNLVPEKKNRYEKIRLDFKVGRITPKSNLRIIFNKQTEQFELHFPRIIKKKNDVGTETIGADKGFSEAFFDSEGNNYAPGIGKVMKAAALKRHSRGKARNHLWQIAQEKPHVHICNLGKKRWNKFERKI